MKEGDRGARILDVLSYLNISIEQMYAFDEGTNDIEMLERKWEWWGEKICECYYRDGNQRRGAIRIKQYILNGSKMNWVDLFFVLEWIKKGNIDDECSLWRKETKLWCLL